MSAEGRPQRLTRVVEPTGQSLPDWQILRNLSWAMDKEMNVRSIDDLRSVLDDQALSHCATGKASPSFVAVKSQGAAGTDAGYPLTLVTRDVLQHSGSLSTRSTSLGLVVTEPFLEIHAQDADLLGVKDGGHVRISSASGSVFLKAKVTYDLLPGVVSSSLHFPHGGVNTLTTTAAAPVAVRVEAAKG